MHILIYPCATYMYTNILYIIQIAPLSMGFTRQEYWSGLPLPSPENARATVKFRQSCLRVHILSAGP